MLILHNDDIFLIHKHYYLDFAFDFETVLDVLYNVDYVHNLDPYLDP